MSGCVLGCRLLYGDYSGCFRLLGSSHTLGSPRTFSAVSYLRQLAHLGGGWYTSGSVRTSGGLLSGRVGCCRLLSVRITKISFFRFFITKNTFFSRISAKKEQKTAKNNKKSLNLSIACRPRCGGFALLWLLSLAPTLRWLRSFDTTPPNRPKELLFARPSVSVRPR